MSRHIYSREGATDANMQVDDTHTWVAWTNVTFHCLLNTH